MRFPALILVPVLALGLTAARAASLPDTGQDKCYDGTSMVTCTSANTGDAATYPRQDGRFGRDAKATAGTLVKIGGGAAGGLLYPVHQSSSSKDRLPARWLPQKSRPLFPLSALEACTLAITVRLLLLPLLSALLSAISLRVLVTALVVSDASSSTT